MAFKIQVTGVDELSKHQLVMEVSIERSLYNHSRARIVYEWDEGSRYNERQTAQLAAKALNCNVEVTWKDNDLAETADCFHGYVERASGQRRATKSRLILDCISASKRTDLVPRYRAFQKTTLQAICQQIGSTEPLITIKESSDLNFDILLSLQYGETDFEYVSRMMHAYGVPMAVSDKEGKVILGARGDSSDGKFPDIGWGWAEVEFFGALEALPKLVGGGSGPTGTTRGKVGEFNGQLKTKARDYSPSEDEKILTEQCTAVKSQIDTAGYRLRLEGGVLPYLPGQVVKFEGQDEIIRSIKITGSPRDGIAAQEFDLQSFTLPYQPYRVVPKWSSRLFWAWVMDNEKDPTQSGRVQVKFDWEDLDPQSSSERLWLPMVTPYGGGKSPSKDKAGEYNGFYSVPEVGERVLVEFLGEWDSDAVVIGTVREKAVNPMYNPKDTKRWRTPSGNEVTMTTKGSTEVVRIKVKDKIFFEGKIDGPNAEALITPGESDGDYIHFKKGAGPPSLYILCDGNISIKAGMKLHLEGQQVQVKAGGGPVNIDGGPLVNINCVPLPFTPNQKQKFEEEKLSTKPLQRKLPQPPTGTAASGGASSGDANQNNKNNEEEKKKTWIEIVLKDDKGHPIPNERYRVKLPDGSTKEGTLDGDGRARVDGIDPGTAQVSFPDIDANEWKPA